MYETNYHNHSEYAPDNHTHWDYAPERHEHNFWEVAGVASADHDHDMSELWDAITTLQEQVAYLMNHQET